MDKVLIVDSDPEFLNRLRESISKLHQFEVLCTSDGKSAIDIISKESISVLVTDMSPEKVDGLELIAHMTRKSPGTPCVVMSSYGRPWFFKTLDQREILYHVEKPVNMVSLVSAIFVGLTLRDENESARGISLKSFLPLLEVERKTCRLEVQSPGKGKGFLYFDGGELIDAYYSDLPPEEAALEMLNWQKISLSFGELPRRRYQKGVSFDLMQIVGATWEKDAILKDEEEEASIATAASFQSEVAGLTASSARKVLNTQVEKFRSIKGFKAIGIMDADLNSLADDFSKDELDLKSIVTSLKPVFYLCSKITERHGFSSCRMFTVHTDDAVVEIMQSNPENHETFYLVGVVEADGNWFFIKFELENLEKQLLESLGRSI